MKITGYIKAAAFAVVTALPNVALAEWQPEGPITLQVSFGAGGSTDMLARAIGAAIEEQTSWDIIVENKPGGGGIAMLSSLVRERPDGLTMGIGVTTPTIQNLAERGDMLPFKADSFDYLGTIALAPLALLAPTDAPYDTLVEFVEHSTANGGSLVGFDAGPQRLMMQAVDNDTNAGFELVSNKSGSEVVQGLLGGHFDAGFVSGAHIQYLESGDLKMLAVATQTRQAYSPDTESFIEQGYPYSVEPYFFIAAPKGLDPEVKETLAGALDAAVNSEALAELIGNLMQTTPNNLGPDGTEDKLINGLADLNALMEAAKQN